MKVIGVLEPIERSERHNVEFPAPFLGAPTVSFDFTGDPAAQAGEGPVALHAAITGWRGQENVKAAWVHVHIEGGSDSLPYRIHYEFEGERGIDGDT